MNKKKSKRPMGQRSFPWDERGDATPLEELIGSTKLQWYSAKHPQKSEKEVSLLNSLPIESCPLCGCGEIVQNGHTRDGVIVRKCKGCPSRFTPLSNTLFDRSRIPLSEWVEFVECLLQYQSINTSAYDNRNARSTGKYWLSKVFACLKGRQDQVVLKGKVWLDETYIKVAFSKRIRNAQGRFLRGLSVNQIQVICATDKKNAVILMGGAGKPDSETVYEAMKDHIESGSLLIHDDEKSHRLLVEKLRLKEEAYPSALLSRLPDRLNPLDPVNNLHSFLKKFFKAHTGIERKELQGWLDLFWFIWTTPGDYSEQTRDLLKLMIGTRKILRYRRFKKKKSS